MAVAEKPRDLRMRAIEDVATPFPIPEITPPETKMNFVFIKKISPFADAMGELRTHLGCPLELSQNRLIFVKKLGDFID